MNYRLDLVVRLVVISIALGFLIYLRLRARRSGLLRHFLPFLAVLLIWTAHPLLYRSLLSDRWPGLALYLDHIYWLTICFTGYVWLLFCLSYVNCGLPPPWRRYLWLAVPPAFFYLAYLTNPSHHLFFPVRGVGVLYWLHTATIYAYVLVGNVLLLGYFRQKYRTARIRAVMLALATSVPLLASICQHYLLFINPSRITPFIDPMPAAFCVTISIFIFVSYKHRFLDILPAAFANIAALTKEALMVFDHQGSIVYANPAFTAAFAYRPREGGNLDDVLAHFGRLIPPEYRPEQALRQAASPAWEGETELAVDAGGRLSWYLLNVNQIREGRGRPLGRVWSFTDITGYKRHTEELQAINDRLTAANAGLARLAAVAGELAAAKEREWLAREIHDSLGHALTVLIAMLETDLVEFAPLNKERAGRTRKMITVARHGITELRRVVASTGGAPEGCCRDLLHALHSLVEAFQATGVRVDLTVSGVEAYDGQSHADTIYRICQEALTNSLRHGSAKNIAILLRFKTDSITMNIIDDGCGCPQVKPGFGLMGMEKRVAALGGNLVYGSLETSGFQIRMELPIEGRVNHDQGSDRRR